MQSLGAQQSARVCFFGDYDPAHNRTKMLIEGLRARSVSVIVCHTTIRTKKKYLHLWRQFFKMRSECDVVLLGFSDDRFMPLVARIITFGKKLVWDTQFSVYDNWVFDRKLVTQGSLKAGYHWFLDWMNCRLVDKIILDFDAHINYFETTFGVSPRRCIRVNGSADTSVFFPRPKPISDGFFRVEYHGKYIPVQGVDTIVRAAKLIEYDPMVKFTLIGDGQDYKKIRALAEELDVKNIEFLPFMPLKNLPKYIAEADVCMGMVGDIPRVERQIPNKLYEAAAMGRFAINADSAAVREIFVDGEDVILMKRGDAQDLVNKILMLKNNPELTEKLSRGALKKFWEKCSPECVGDQLCSGIQNRR